MREYQLFLSYSRSDIWIMRSVLYHLQSYGIHVWVDTRTERGTEWRGEIENAIAKCNSFAIIITPESVKSPWVASEYKRAIELRAKDSNRRIHPILACDPELVPEDLREFEISDIHYKKVNVGKLSFETEMNQLAQSILQLRETPRIPNNHLNLSRMGSLFWFGKDLYYVYELLNEDRSAIHKRSDMHYIAYWLRQALYHAQQLELPLDKIDTFPGLINSIEHLDPLDQSKRAELAHQIHVEIFRIAAHFETLEPEFRRFPFGMPPSS